MKTVDEMIEAIDNYSGKEVVDFIEEKASEDHRKTTWIREEM